MMIALIRLPPLAWVRLAWLLGCYTQQRLLRGGAKLTIPVMIVGLLTGLVPRNFNFYLGQACLQ